MCAHFNLILVTVEAPFEDIITTCLLERVTSLYMEDAEGMETDLIMSVAVKMLVFHQVGV